MRGRRDRGQKSERAEAVTPLALKTEEGPRAEDPRWLPEAGKGREGVTSGASRRNAARPTP